MKRKLFLGLGTIASIAAPIAAVVSCGDEIANGKMSWNRNDNQLTFNLSSKAAKGAFESYLSFKDDATVLKTKGFVDAAKDFAKATTQNNVRKLKDGEVINVETFIETFTAHDITNATDDLKDGHQTNFTTSTKHRINFSFVYHAEAKKAWAKTKEFGEQKNNFLEMLVEAFHVITGLDYVTTANADEMFVLSGGTTVAKKEDFTETAKVTGTGTAAEWEVATGDQSSVKEAIKTFMKKADHSIAAV